MKNGNNLNCGDSMIAGLRGAKVSRNRKVKIRFLPGAKAEDLMFHLIPYLNKKHNNSDENAIYLEIKKIKYLIKTYHPDSKNIFISSPILRFDNKTAANALKNYINILKKEEHNIILHDNINGWHLHRDGLHLNVKGTIALAENFLSSI